MTPEDVSVLIVVVVIVGYMGLAVWFLSGKRPK